MATTIIAPAITCESFEDYQASITRLEPFATRVHIDIADGEFAPTFLVGTDQLYWPASWEVDIHAMVARPSEHLQALLTLKPHTIIFHTEVQEDLAPTLIAIKEAGIKAGIALLRPTVPKTVAPLIELADHVMIFSGDLGHYGGTASLMQLEKIRLVRSIHPAVEIGWDGGASMENVFSLAQGGVDVINAGGAISKADDPEKAYKDLSTEANRQGVM